MLFDIWSVFIGVFFTFKSQLKVFNFDIILLLYGYRVVG